MKFNFKSCKGFTLIELLVVIGILAVLAAIAIPSVAGLIDRANVSADNANANEMTNAIERFTSEYEIYCQDIASNSVDFTYLDSTQGRVHNVTGISNRNDTTLVEEYSLHGICINRDTKYPQNVATVKKVIENYMKTNSSTFEPKQSDMHYWYSPDCGVVICDTKEATYQSLNKKVVSGTDAKGNKLSYDTIWFDLTANYKTASILIHNDVVPQDAKYTDVDGNIYDTGDTMPTPRTGDKYEYGQYEYYFNMIPTGNPSSGWTYIKRAQNGWNVKVKPEFILDTEFNPIITTINDFDIVAARCTFEGCKNATDFPMLPSTIRYMYETYEGCYALADASHFILPQNIETGDALFMYCYGLKKAPVLNTHNVLTLKRLFLYCHRLSGTVIINANSLTDVADCFGDTSYPITIVGNNPKLNELVNSSSNGNVTIG